MSTTDTTDLTKLKIKRGEQPTDGAKSTRPRMLLAVGGLVIVLFLIVMFLLDGFSPVPEVETTRVTLVRPSVASALLTASGYVVAQRKAAIASKATGRLVYLGFEEGDEVKKGKIIARIESADVEAQLVQAKATRAMSRAELIDAERSFERAKTLLASQLIAQSEYDVVKSRFDRVVASIAAADASVRGAEVQLENTMIRAPFDGTILSKNADVGEVVAPFGAGASSRVAVVTIADMNSLEVEADVSESNIERVNSGQPCEIVLDAYPDQRYRGIVSKIVPTADRAKATVLTKIRFLERDKRVLPEMSAKVHFLSKATEQNDGATATTMVESSALVTRDGRSSVFRVHENVIDEVLVEVGQQYGKTVEIRSGLSANDIVVSKPTQSLKSGMKVKIK